ncbi:MAG: hypothetical protein ABFR62_06590 [Bacteroidota bacterium]
MKSGEMRQVEYPEIRELMLPGDVIAFGGDNCFSKIIKLVTRSNVSHLGIILQRENDQGSVNEFSNKIIEANGEGITTNTFSDVLKDYGGDVWWLPLNNEIRNNYFDENKFREFLGFHLDQRKKYDLWQVVKLAIDILSKIPFLDRLVHNKENFDKFFCSELVAAGIKAAGIAENINSSRVTPIDLCRWKIYDNVYYQLKKETPKYISGYNSKEISKHFNLKDKIKSKLIKWKLVSN